MEIYQVEISIDGVDKWIDLGLTKIEHGNPSKYIFEKLKRKYPDKDLLLLNYIHMGTEFGI